LPFLNHDFPFRLASAGIFAVQLLYLIIVFLVTSPDALPPESGKTTETKASLR
jgi:hypothetical protein